MYELPTLNDSDILAIIGAHPEGFFETMKEFEPYILICAGATRLEIKLKNSYVDLAKLEATFERLDRLGYHPEAHNVTYTKPNGEQVIDLGNITIDWEKHDKPEGVKMSFTGRGFCHRRVRRPLWSEMLYSGKQPCRQAGHLARSPLSRSQSHVG